MLCLNGKVSNLYVIFHNFQLLIFSTLLFDIIILRSLLFLVDNVIYRVFVFARYPYPILHFGDNSNIQNKIKRRFKKKRKIFSLSFIFNFSLFSFLVLCKKPSTRKDIFSPFVFLLVFILFLTIAWSSCVRLFAYDQIPIKCSRLCSISLSLYRCLSNCMSICLSLCLMLISFNFDQKPLKCIQSVFWSLSS